MFNMNGEAFCGLGFTTKSPTEAIPVYRKIAAFKEQSGNCKVKAIWTDNPKIDSEAISAGFGPKQRR